MDPTKRAQGRLTGSVVAGKYRLDEALAEGGMGVIYRAWHLVLDQPIVIKVLQAELLDKPEASLRFLNEARAAACLRGANVARVLDSGAISMDGKKLPYIVLEYLVGADLRTVLERHGALPLEQSVDFILQACEALAEAHLSGIIHRDVKPENLFLTEQPDGSAIVKLLDFGIAKRVGVDPLRESTGTHSLGSPHYMAPEQMYLPHGVDARADIWSLGVVLYELLTLRVPFEGDSLAGVYARVVRQEPVPPSRLRPDLPDAIDRAISGCLAKAKRQRTASVRDLALALAPFGSSRAHESLRRIQRLFDRHADTPVEIEVDVGELAPELESDSLRLRRGRRGHIRQAGFVAFALTVLAIALPAHSTLREASARSLKALAPLGERIRVLAEHPREILFRMTRREAAPPRVADAPAPLPADALVPLSASTDPSPVALATREEAPLGPTKPHAPEPPGERGCVWNRALAPWAPLAEAEKKTADKPTKAGGDPSDRLLWPDEPRAPAEPRDRSALGR